MSTDTQYFAYGDTSIGDTMCPAEFAGKIMSGVVLEIAKEYDARMRDYDGDGVLGGGGGRGGGRVEAGVASLAWEEATKNVVAMYREEGEQRLADNAYSVGQEVHRKAFGAPIRD